ALESEEVKVRALSGSKEAVAALNKENWDCVVLDLPDAEGFRVLQAIHANPERAILPTIVYLSSDLTKEEETELKRLAKACVLKEAKSLERVVDEAALFLHQATDKLPAAKRSGIE